VGGLATGRKHRGADRIAGCEEGECGMESEVRELSECVGDWVNGWMDGWMDGWTTGITK
jgi:hypothetical protein